LLLPNLNILCKQKVYMQKLLLIGLFWTGVKITLIFNLNFHSNAMAIENGYMQEGNNNISLIHIGYKFLACVASDDLRPPEGQECEKRILKKFGEPNVLYAR
jgi:hypothetical protein